MRIFHFGLNINMREHTVRQDVLDPECDQHVLQGCFHCCHGFRSARYRIGPKQHVADSVRKSIEDLPTDIIDIVGW